jgi:molybdenum cofactor biosynthesis protein MoaC
MKEIMETHGTLQPSEASEAASFRMIDIGEKKDTQRRAVASGVFFAKEDTIQRIREKSLPKGNVLLLAEAAGIQGAKLTSTLLPLCHPLSLTSVRVWMKLLRDQIQVFCEAKTIGKTGVEMEALCGVNAALLCLYDLTKGIDPVLEIGDVHLELKEGGKSGVWRHPESSSQTSSFTSQDKPKEKSLQGISASVITLSDRCFRKEAEDLSGPLASNWLSSQGAKIENTLILPDDSEMLKRELKRLVESKKVRVIVTSGGTGISTRDITPETVLSLSQDLGGKEVLGIGELLRKSGAHYTKKSWLSRSCAYLVQGILILCLPGSPNAVKESLEEAGDLISHCLHIASGGGHS